MRISIIILLCAILSGCPIIFEATVRNETNNPIELVWASSRSKEPILIESTATVVIPWYVLCVTVGSNESLRHYQVPEFLPKHVQTSGRFSSRVTFPVVITDEGLYFQNKSGELIPIQEVAECGRT